MQPSHAQPGDLPGPLGPYHILREISRGGMGRVYLAEDTRLGRSVALKVPRTDLPCSEELRERFLRDARTAASIPFHANLCPIYDAGCIDGVPYLSMPFLEEGPSLAETGSDYSRRPAREAVALLRSIAQGVAQLHRAGLVHRDIKPRNILFTARGEPVLVDFGLAVNPAQPGEGAGSCDYAAPEQLTGQFDALDARSDTYALGVLLYRLLTGELPFTRNVAEQIRGKQQGSLSPPSRLRPDVADLDAICLKALAPAPENRYADAGAFAADLCAYLGESAPPAPQPPTDPHVPESIMSLLREWGWEGAREHLQARVRATADPHERGLLRLLLAWQDAEHGWAQQALAEFEEVAHQPELRSWALVGQAFVALSRHDVPRALALLDQVPLDDQREPRLGAAVAHARGVAFYRKGQDAQALQELYRATNLFSPEHLGYGRVLDSLAMVYAAMNDYPTALALFERALMVKQKHDDLPGLALTHGQLGRLCLDWGDLEMAEQEFRHDLKLAQRLGDRSSEGQMYNHLGQVYLARGRAQQALEYLDESVRSAQVGGWSTRQAYAHKDRALAHLALDHKAAALADVEAAERLFQESGYPEGVSHVRRARAQVLAKHEQYEEAERLLIQAAAHFERSAEPAETARAYRELAQVRRQRGAMTLAAEAYHSALDHAEKSRRDRLVSEVEQELADVDAVDHYRWVLKRVRGQGIHDNAMLMEEATSEEATVLFLDLSGFTSWSKMQLAQVVRRTLNQLFAALTPALEKHGIVVNQHLGDGFMALVRGEKHARRAVLGGLQMLEAVKEFNRPRRLLDWSELQARIGVCSGPMVFGNVGTPRKIDYTGVGEAVNKASRVQNEARPGEAVCVAEETRQRMGDGFLERDPAGRTAKLKGLGDARLWDVVGLRE